MFRRNRQADRAHIESEDVAADNVLRTGDKDIRARNMRMKGLKILTGPVSHFSKVRAKTEKEQSYERSSRL